MIRRPPRSTQSRSSAASDVYKRQRRDFHTIDEPDASDLAQGGVRLLGGGGVDARADPALLGRTLERRRLGALLFTLAPLAYELAYGCHLTSLVGRFRQQSCSFCLLYTSDAADDLLCVDLGG